MEKVQKKDDRPYVSERHSIKNEKIGIYKFYDVGQRIFRMNTVPSNSYQQDIFQKNVFFGPV